MSSSFAVAAPNPFEGRDSKQPVRIEADSLEVSRPDGMALFTGNVSAVQGALTITGDVMKVFYTEAGSGSQAPGVRKIEITGKVKVTNGRDEAVGRKAVYDADKNNVTLEGDNLTLKSGPHTLKGGRLLYDIVSGHSRLEGDVTGGGRVTGVFIPGVK